MARVLVRTEDFVSGRLPMVCAETGEPADGYMEMTASKIPGWIFILLLFGILPFLVGAIFGQRSVKGQVPMSQGARRAITWRKISMLALALAGIIILIIRGGSTVDGYAGLSLIAVALIVAFANLAMTPAATPQDDGILVSHVHPAFADAVNDFYDNIPSRRR